MCGGWGGMQGCVCGWMVGGQGASSHSEGSLAAAGRCAGAAASWRRPRLAAVGGPQEGPKGRPPLLRSADRHSLRLGALCMRLPSLPASARCAGAGCRLACLGSKSVCLQRSLRHRPQATSPWAPSGLGAPAASAPARAGQAQTRAGRAGGWNPSGAWPQGVRTT